MKLYCVLYDTMPFTKDLVNIAKMNDLTILKQIGKCYTFASLSSMLTGELACDLLKDGIGWSTWQVYRNSETGELKLPWLSRMLPEIFRKAGWKVHAHNYSRYRKNVDTDPNNIYTELINTGAGEKEFIRREQNIKSEQNIMYFFYYDHFHDSIMNRRGEEDAKKLTYELMSFWDFSEPDAMFWFFSDHGSWIGFEERKYPTPTNYLSWVLFKDNIKPSVEVDSKFISIRDFYATMVDKFKLNKAPLISDIYPIQKSQDKDRIYYVEDARAAVDKYNSTVAIACKFVDWKDNKPNGILQVIYYKPDDEFISMHISLDCLDFESGLIKMEKVDVELKDALLNRIEWIPR